MHYIVRTALILIFVFTIINLCSSNCQYQDDTRTLVLAHVLFRHGNRTVDLNQSYPKDPYINETYRPFGFGQLTNKGKQREFLLGKIIRSRYNKFLGSVYSPAIIEAVSTEFDRTKMSLELFLAGLYPPKGTVMEWEKELNWQPIPYSYLLPEHGSHLLSFPLSYCSKYVELYEAYVNSTEGKMLDRKYAKIYQYLTKHTGLNVTSLLGVVTLYVTLVAEEDWGFKLPAWTKQVYPEMLDRGSGDFFSSSTSTPELKQLSGGFLLKKIINDTQAKIENKLNPPNKKLFIYSAHDVNVAYLLSTLNVFYPHEPTYGACVLVEVHKINGVHGIKVYYQNYEQPNPKLLKIPGCDNFCPFQKFVKLFKRNLPEGNDPCEDDKSDKSKLRKDIRL